MYWSNRRSAALAAALTLYSGSAEAFWRLPCRGQAGVARMDPLVQPGVPSDHAHVIHGASNFALTVDQDILRASKCTSCAVKQDLSNYWVPSLYFMHKNGTAEMVEEVGGMLAYYLLYGDNIKAFPANFRMVAGDPFLRNFTWPIPDPPKSEWSGDQVSQFALQQKAIGFNCLDYSKQPEASLYRHFLPDKDYLDANCKDGVRFELMFPSCWNGKDLDTPDHKSHMAYPSLVMNGDCPPGFETRLPSLFYETIWNTYAFKDKEGEFVIANGDPTGFGYHGDFITGWDPDFLQQAVDTCTNPSGEVQDCPLFELQSEEDQQQCKFEVPEILKLENAIFDLVGLPGNVLIQRGPEEATKGATSQPALGGISIPTPSLPGLDLPLPSLIQNAVNQGVNAINGAASSSAATTPAVTTAPVLTYSPAAPTPTPLTTQSEVEVVTMRMQVVVTVDCDGNPVGTTTRPASAIATATETETITTTLPPTAPAAAKRDQVPGHIVHGHAHRRRNYKGGVDGWF
ncbi:hypothetical protein VTN00DRAFT_6461 [Thermoascus crustaceus]|uniref:uncharacterized protein n=1 Tax=Thermoascus crustaceus TaxID=5088 RepID=UPI0037432957